MTTLRCTDDRYDPNGSTYSSVLEFVTMVRCCFGDEAADALDVTDEDVRDPDGTVILHAA